MNTPSAPIRLVARATAALLAGLLAAASPGFAADATADAATAASAAAPVDPASDLLTPLPPPPPLPEDYAGFAPATGLAPAVNAAADAWHPAKAAKVAHPVRRVTLSKSIARNGRPVSEGTQVVVFPADHPGYAIQALDMATGILKVHETSLSRGFLALDTRTQFTSPGIQPRVATRWVATEVTLPASFEAAVKPGATWNYQVTEHMDADFVSKVNASSESKTRVRHYRCTNSARRPADMVSKAFAGSMIAIRCKSDEAGDNAITWAWLENEGVFLPMEGVRRGEAGPTFDDLWEVRRVER